MLKKIYNNLGYIIGTIIFITPFFWFQNSNYAAGGEIYTILDALATMKKNLFCWNSLYGFGLPNIYFISFLHGFINYLLSAIASISLSQKIFFGLSLSLTFSSFLSLLKYLFHNKFRGACLLAALFYVFNPFYVMMFHWIPAYQYLFVLTPLIIKYIFKVYEEGKTKNFIYLFVLLILFSVVGLNLALFGLLFIIIFLYYFILIISNRHAAWKNTKTILIILLLIFISNCFWILPFSQLYKSIYGNAIVYPTNFQEKSIFSQPILKALTLNEYYWFDRNNSDGVPYYDYHGWYQIPSIIILLSLLILVIIGVFIIKKNPDRLHAKLIFFFAILFLLGIFATKGIAEPFGIIYKDLLAYFKPFSVYRASDLKFPYLVLVSFAYLLCFSLSALEKYKLKKYLYTLIFISIIFLGSPLFTGKIFNDKFKLQVPSYWSDFSKSQNSEKLDGRVLLFPKNFSPFDNFIWGYEGGWLTQQLLNQPSLGFTQGYGSSIQEKNFSQGKIIYDFFEKNQIDSLKKSLGIFNIKQIIMRNDFDLKKNITGMVTYDTAKILNYSAESMAKNLWPYFSKTKSFGQIDIYDVGENNFLPLFYTPEKTAISQESLDNLSLVISNLNINRSAIFLSDQNKEFPQALAGISDLFMPLFKKDSLASENTYEQTNTFFSADFLRQNKFILAQRINSDLICNLRYDAKSRRVIISDAPLQNIFINSQAISGNNNNIAAVSASIGDTIKIDDEFMNLNINTNTSLKCPTRSIEIYNSVNNQIDESFENNTWASVPGDCSNKLPGAADFSLSLSNDASAGNKSVQIGSKNHYACIAKTFSANSEKEKIYKFTFDYKIVKGEFGSFYLNLKHGKENDIYSEKVSGKLDQWNTYEKFITPKNNIDGIDLYLYAQSDGSREIIINYDNIKFQELNLKNVFNLLLEDKILVADKDVKINEKNEIKFEANYDAVLEESFENGLWNDKAGDCTATMSGKPEISLSSSNDASDGRNSLELESKNHHACSSKYFTVNLSPEYIYKFSFDYKNVKGNVASYFVNFYGNKKNYPFSGSLQIKNNQWTHYEKYITPEENIKGFDLYFYAPSYGLKEIINRYDNIKLEKFLPKNSFNYYIYSEGTKISNTPIIEFKKINPVKYKVEIHGAVDSIPLVFSESFDINWKAYLTNYTVKEIGSGDDNTNITPDNQPGQATNDEIKNYIAAGWISALGKNFISKNYQGTIQNDNLLNGRFYETFFKKPIPAANHLMVNGYANSWWLDIGELCQEQDKCQKNADGSYNLEMVIEFWPQRWFYLGLIISGLTLLACVLYLIYCFIKKHGPRNKN